MADRIMAARKGISFTQAELASALGVSPRAVQKWEAGETKPRPRTIRELAELTERPLDYFVEVAA